MTNRVFFSEFLRHRRGGDTVSPQKLAIFSHIMPDDVNNSNIPPTAFIVIKDIH